MASAPPFFSRTTPVRTTVVVDSHRAASFSQSTQSLARKSLPGLPFSLNPATFLDVP